MNERHDTPLPQGGASGRDATWYLRTVTDDPAADDGVLALRARFLGVGSSRRDRHAPHPGAFAAKEQHCGVCRWFETRIFRVGPNEYVLHHVGRSIVPGEQDLMRHERAWSAAEVIERYTVRPGPPEPGEAPREPFLARPAARALAQAVAHDTDLRDAYENRAVL